MFEMIEDFEPLEQFEMTEAMELVEQQKEIAHKLELNQKWHEKALSEGSLEMAEFLQKEMDELKASQISLEGKLDAHQGVTSEETTDDDDYHQGMMLDETGQEADCLWRESYEDDSGTIIETTGGQARSSEISFGSSDIKTLEARADKWLKDVEFHEGQIETNTKLERDTSKNMSDLKSAKRQYEMAVKELEWARKHQ